MGKNEGKAFRAGIQRKNPYVAPPSPQRNRAAAVSAARTATRPSATGRSILQRKEEVTRYGERCKPLVLCFGVHGFAVNEQASLQAVN